MPHANNLVNLVVTKGGEMIPENLLEQVYSIDGKRHLAIMRLGKVEDSTLCGLSTRGNTGRVHPCNCDECRKVANP